MKQHLTALTSLAAALTLSAALATPALAGSNPFQWGVAGDPSQWGRAAVQRKVNEYEGQHRKVNEYEGQHRLGVATGKDPELPVSSG